MVGSTVSTNDAEMRHHHQHHHHHHHHHHRHHIYLKVNRNARSHWLPIQRQRKNCTLSPKKNEITTNSTKIGREKSCRLCDNYCTRVGRVESDRSVRCYRSPAAVHCDLFMKCIKTQQMCKQITSFCSFSCALGISLQS